MQWQQQQQQQQPPSQQPINSNQLSPLGSGNENITPSIPPRNQTEIRKKHNANDDVSYTIARRRPKRKRGGKKKVDKPEHDQRVKALAHGLIKDRELLRTIYGFCIGRPIEYLRFSLKRLIEKDEALAIVMNGNNRRNETLVRNALDSLDRIIPLKDGEHVPENEPPAEYEELLSNNGDDPSSNQGAPSDSNNRNLSMIDDQIDQLNRIDENLIRNHLARVDGVFAESDSVTPREDLIVENRFKSQQDVAALAKKKKCDAVKKVYRIVKKITGEVGGSGSGGPIYGELTIGNMQKVIDFLITNADFSESSRFIDIGCGLGKPNLHVAQDPGVEVSFGIEVEKIRSNLGNFNLHHILKAAKNDAKVGHNCILQHGDITQASSLDPFTHVYEFDVG